jgi:hypothetical protein
VRLLDARAWIGDTKPDTAPADAVANPQAFAQRAAIQAGRAGLEADRAEMVRATITALAPSAGGWLTTALGAIGGASGAGAIGLWLGRTIIARYRSALKTTAQLADDVAEAETDDQVEIAKAKALTKQTDAGVHSLVQSVRGKA